MQTSELRPLGAGEMLDRAITLFVRRFVAIAAVLLVVTVPVTVLQALADPQSASVFGDFAKLLSSMGDPVASRQAADELSRKNTTSAAAFAVVFGGVLVRLLMWCALVRVVSTAYAGAVTSLADAYRFAAARWFPQLGVALAFLILGMFAAIPIFVLYIIVVLGAVALVAAHLSVAGIVFGVAGGLVVISAAVVLESIAFMTYELASVALLTETPNFVEAIGMGLRRGLARGMKRRTLVGGIVVFLVSQAGLIPILGLAIVLTTVTHVTALYYAVFGAGSLLLDGIVASFVVVFAVDARVRCEGLDLQDALAVP